MIGIKQIIIFINKIFDKSKLYSFPSIYYQTNLLNYINSYKEIDLNVYFYRKFDIHNLNFDSEFEKEVKFTKKNKIRYHYAFLNNPKNLLKILAEIFNYKQKSVFWFHGWNHYSIILLSVIIKIFSKKKIFIRAENIYKDKIFSRIFKFFYLSYLIISYS